MLNVIKNWFDIKFHSIKGDNDMDPGMLLARSRKRGGEELKMAHKPTQISGAISGRSAARSGGLAKLAAGGIYQFRGSGGEKITMINKEKLRTTTAGVSSKSRK